MLHVVCYDISNDRSRDQMSRRLLDFGTRIQESVFECLLDDALYERLIVRLESVPLGEDDRVRIYRICADCVKVVKIYGKGRITVNEHYYVV